jgi:hypothetical protein
MKTEDHQETLDPVWDLLAHRSQPCVPQDFVSQVLAEVRQTPQEIVASPSMANVVAFPAPRRHGLLWGSLAAAAAIAMGLFIHFRPADQTQIVQQGSSPEFPQVVMPSGGSGTPGIAGIVGNDEGSLEQELTAVQDVHALLAVEDPKQLNDAQLFALLN